MAFNNGFPIYQMMQGFGMNPMISQFMAFRNTFKGDAKAQVQELLNSGRVSQADYNRAVQMANQLQSMLAPFGRR